MMLPELKKNSTQYVKSFTLRKLNGKTSKYGRVLSYNFLMNFKFSMNNIEHDNGRLIKDLGHLNKQYQRLKNNHEKLVEKNKQLESRVEEQETIIEHMREIVFNDTSEDAG